jgi:hypothetical protein
MSGGRLDVGVRGAHLGVERIDVVLHVWCMHVALLRVACVVRACCVRGACVVLCGA